MKLHKTWTDKRNTYVYEFYDLDDFKKEIVIKPGENGVTEVDIKQLHNMDDREIEQNQKYVSPPLSDEEKAERSEWKENYIKTFERRHGYRPCKVDVDYAFAERFSKRTILSIDDFNEQSDNLPNFLCRTDKDESLEEIREHIAELLKPYPASYMTIYKEFLLCGRKGNGAVSKKLHLSPGRVSQIADDIEKILRNDTFLKNFYYTAKKNG